MSDFKNISLNRNIYSLVMNRLNHFPTGDGKIKIFDMQALASKLKY